MAAKYELGVKQNKKMQATAVHSDLLFGLELYFLV
jgi:hypothetical protein